MHSYQEIKAALVQVMDANDVKPGSKRAQDIEYAFLKGMVFTEPKLATTRPLLLICLTSGRSLLDTGTVEEKANQE